LSLRRLSERAVFLFWQIGMVVVLMVK